jgi:cytosine/adenosine deaminase-related metal-dependent hydrolase
MADAGVHVSMAPTTDAQSGFGESIVPIQRCLDAGLNPSLSADTESTQFTDLFSVMRMVLNVQHMMAANAAFNGGPEVDLLTARDVLRYATVEGARASGLITCLPLPGALRKWLPTSLDQVTAAHDRIHHSPAEQRKKRSRPAADSSSYRKIPA